MELEELKEYLRNNPNDFLQGLADLKIYPYFGRVLYYYTTYETAKIILENGTIRISSPYLFNDPFEMTEGLLDWSLTHKKMKERFYRMGRLQGMTDERIQYILSRNTIQSFKDAHKQGLEELKRKARVLCLSKANDTTLMWSHYGNKHTGVCIGLYFYPVYDDGYIDFMTLCVNYEDQIRKLNAFATDDEQRNFALFYWIFTKSKVWEYEKEVRVFFSNKEGRLCNDPNVMCYDLELERRFFRELHFGLSMPKEQIDELMEIAIRKGYPLNSTTQMSIDHTTFGLKSNPINR